MAGRTRESEDDPRERVPSAGPARRIHARCLARGWGAGRLAREAGISRTTACQLLAGEADRPRMQTLEKVAAALDVPLAELLTGSASSRPAEAPTDSISAPRAFDRRTNPAISEVAVESPHLFADWTPDDWDELYSTFGAGGALTPHGVRESAGRINRNRDTLQQTRLLLETHLSEVTARLIDTLHRMVRPIGNFAPSSEIAALIDRARRRD